MKKTIVIAVLVMSTNVVAMDAHQSNTSDLAYVDVSVEKKGRLVGSTTTLNSNELAPVSQ